MQLREIHVTRFGTLRDVHVRGLSTGLNVLYGPNEFGKTSMLEFVRRILFGFPDKRSKLSQYEVPGSDRNAGRLTCELKNGTVLDVLRTTGKGGGPLTVTSTDGTHVAEQRFSALLGHASSDLYRSVFSLDLADLFEKDATDVPEVRDRLYAAGLGGVSPTDVKERFQRRADELFTKGGRTQTMKQLADQITERSRDLGEERQRLAGYDDRKREIDDLRDHARQLVEMLRQARSTLRSLEDQEHLYQTVHDMRTSERELAGMGDVPAVTDETITELRERQADLERLVEQLSELQDDIKQKTSALERISFDPVLIEHDADIRSLARGLTGYRAMIDELPGLHTKAATGHTRVRQLLLSLGDDWTEEHARGFVLTTEQRDSLRQKETTLKEKSDARDEARRTLKTHQDAARARASGRRPTASPIRLLGAAVLTLGAVGSIVAVVGNELLLAGIAGAVAAIGLAIALQPGSLRHDKADPYEDSLQQQLGQTEEALGAAQADWCALLSTVGLPSTLSPVAKDEFLRTVDDIRRELQAIDEIEGRISLLNKGISDVDGLYSIVAGSTHEPLPADVASGIELLEARLTEARTAKVKTESLAEDIHQREQKVRHLEKERIRQESALRQMIQGHGSSSASELENRYRVHCQAEALRKSIDSKRHDIETRVGPGKAYETLVAVVENTPLTEIRDARAELQEKTRTLEDELDASNQRIGGLDTELKSLVSEEDLVSRESALEMLQQQLQDAYREWLTARIAMWGVDSAVSRYEEERQPEVIRAAQERFCTMTGCRYTKIIKSVDSEGLRVRDSEGNERTVDQLSRGTREQLHLAMRLGLIEQYEQNSEPLPVVMDDVLVNFDDERGPLAIRALAEFAADRQLIVMTCHESAREMYRQAGANELTLRGR